MQNSYSCNLTNASKLGVKLANQISGGEVFGLIGPLGSGKTTFVKAFGKTLGIKQPIPSPTFAIWQHFKGKLPKTKKPLTLHHLDVYRLKDLNEFKYLGIEEYWGQKGSITLIEWADLVKESLPHNTTYVTFQ